MGDCQIVLRHLMSLVKQNGLLCIADEVRGEKSHAKLEQAIFRPFLTYLHAVLAKHPLHPIYDYDQIICQEGFTQIDCHRDKTDYICSWVYRK